MKPLAEGGNRRRVLFHDVLVLQLKLLMSGWLHFLLAPATLVAVVVDLLSKSESSHFYRVLKWGHQADEALGLFAVLESGDRGSRPEAAAPTLETPPQ